MMMTSDNQFSIIKNILYLKMDKLILRPDQVDHIDTLESIMKKYRFAMDLSAMGSGKTITTMWIANKYNYPLLIITTASLAMNWEGEAKIHNFPRNRLSTMTINVLRGTSDKKAPIEMVDATTIRRKGKISHGLLTRWDYTRTTPKRTIEYSEYEPTEKFKLMVANGLLMVFDEADSGKNDSLTNRAFAALAFCMYHTPNTISRYMLLSGTLYDKPELAVNIYKLLGLTKHSQLLKVNNFQGTVELLALKTIIAFCNIYDPDMTDELVSVVIPDRRNPSLKTDAAKTLAYDLFTSVMMPTFASAMEASHIDSTMIDLYYLVPDGPVLDELNKGVMSLAHATGYISDNNSIEIKNFGEIALALMKLEDAKVPLIEHRIRTLLYEEPNRTFVVALTYKDPIHELYTRLNKDYKVRVITGDVPPQERIAITKQFRETNDIQIVIIGKQVGSHGISLHDTLGGRPRTMIIVPNYSITQLYQLAGRVARSGQKTKPTVEFIYGTDLKKKLNETSILNALARKSSVLKKIALNNNNPLPGELEPIDVLYE